jgi:hypothetical protein
MARDEFPARVIDVLAKRVGYHCSSPDCGRPTVGPHSEPGTFVKVGVAAHITAASVGGPRYDPSLTTEQRTDISNGIWLCCDCGKLIDSDEAKYTPDLLRKWKADKEAELEAQIKSGFVPDLNGPPLVVSSPMRIGCIGYVALENGSRVPRARIIGPEEDPARYTSACVFRLVIKPVQITEPTILLGVGVEVLSVEPIPSYKPLMGVYPTSFSVYVLPFDDPNKAGTSHFMAEKFYRVREGQRSEELPYQPVEVDRHAPEVLDLRLSPRSPGMFNLQIFAQVAVGTSVKEQDLVPPMVVIVPAPEKPQ